MNKDDLNITREEIIALRQNDKPNHRKCWAKEDRQKIIDMHQAGVGITEMAVIFQRSEAAIFNQINQLCLTRRTRSPNRSSYDCKCPDCSFYGHCTKIESDVECKDTHIEQQRKPLGKQGNTGK